MRKRVLGALVSASLLLFSGFVAAHAERWVDAPARPGSVPDPNRTATATLDVCKTEVNGVPECAYQDIQAAVNAAPDGALIQVWPGLYEELPSRAASSLPPDLNGRYSYQHHVDHPNSQNLVAVIGKKDITLRGMGDDPDDVVIDVAFAKHVGIRGDRADGLVIQNLAVYHAHDHNVYVLDQDGFWIEKVHSYYGFEYDFLMFAVDHGVLKDCLAVGAGDAGIYPGGTADTPGRYSVEVSGCTSVANVLGYSGTQGNYIWVHDNVFEDNAVGMVSDSETDHPNYPQKGDLIEDNVFRNNNLNVYQSCHATWGCIEPTVFVGSILIPVGVGLFLASNLDNTVTDNTFYGNDRFGAWLASGQGIVLGPVEGSEPPFTSANNRFIGNTMTGPSGEANGIDFGWDGLGTGNCWEDNVGAGGSAATSDATFLPPCTLAGETLPTTAGAPNPENAVAQVGLVYAEGHPMCFWLGLEPCIGGDIPYTGSYHNAARNEPEGYVAPPTPPTCGPSSDESCWA